MIAALIARLIILCVLTTIIMVVVVWKYRKAIDEFDGWSDLAHRVIKTILAIGLILCLTGCALFSDNAEKRKELGRQLGILAKEGAISLVTGNPLPAVGGAISFLGYLFGVTGTAYAVRQRHKFRTATAPPPAGFPVVPLPAADVPPPGSIASNEKLAA